MNEYTHTKLATCRNAELAAKARKARLTSKNAAKATRTSWFDRIAKPLTLADVR
ncbi:hypothetical protein [Tenggerimyces flavus]|uniref:Uncharacterized protein n=1 Tax=Tenggerimyces flavus TaxID=1708749 RepID=A0ABV7YFP1_9ACTN|nr:hypothetical protein [Tenggerimyces flavus]MBM7783375.1 hypothetical protein [Tenggerimyces flavus]